MKKTLSVLAFFCALTAFHAHADQGELVRVLGLNLESVQEIDPSDAINNADIEMVIETPFDVASVDPKSGVGCKVFKGVASTYGGSDGLAGKETAAGHCMLPYAEIPRAAMLASRVPLGAIIHVRCGGKEITGAVDDRGPFNSRILDASPKIADFCGFHEATRTVQVTWCGEIDHSVLGGHCGKRTKSKKRRS